MSSWINLGALWRILVVGLLAARDYRHCSRSASGP